MDSSSNATYTLEEEDYEEFKKNGIPTMAYLIVLCIVGTIGNAHVFLVYWLGFKASVHQIFVLCLAGVDFVGCIFCIPATIYLIRHPYTIQSTPYCKVYRAIAFSVGTYSLLILDWIAMERFRKVCQTSRVQFTTRTTRIVCAVSFVLILVLVVVPVTILYGINRKTTKVHLLLGFECSVLNNFIGSMLMKAYMGSVFIIYVSLVVISAVLYISIWKTIHVQLNKSLYATTTFVLQDSNHTGSKSVSPKGDLTQDDRSQEKNIETSAVTASFDSDADFLKESFVTPEVSHDNTMKDNSTKPRHGNQQKRSTATRSKRKRQLDRSRTVTLVFLVVSIVSFVGYLPYLIVVLIWNFNSSLYQNFANNYGILDSIFCNLFFLNHVINPFIYGFLDKKFRAELLKSYVNIKNFCYEFLTRSKAE